MAQRVSFSDVLEDEADRILDSIWEENPKIKNFEDFDNAFREKWNSPKGENAKITADDVVKLFNTKECKNKIKENVSDEELEELYGDGMKIERQAVSKTKVVTIIYKKIHIHSHIRAGIKVKSYSKGYTKWKPLELKFLSIRKKDKKLTPKQIISQYNAHFKEGARSSSSIKTQIYRL
jgi:hypothetical protein